MLSVMILCRHVGGALRQKSLSGAVVCFPVLVALVLPPCPVSVLGNEAGIPIVDGGATSWKYDEMWRVSSDDVLFGNVGDVKSTEDGLLVVSDVQLGKVLLFGPGGGLETEIAVRGEGPGHLTTLNTACDDGNNGLLLTQFWPPRIEQIDRQGTPVRTMRRQGQNASRPFGLASVELIDGHLLAVMAEMQFLAGQEVDNRIALSLLSSDLESEKDLYRIDFVTVSRHGAVDETAGWFPINAWTTIDTDLVALAPDRDDYRIKVCRFDGSEAAIYSLDAEARPRTQVEIDRVKAGYSLYSNGVRQEIDFKLFENSEAIEKMVGIGGNRVFALTSRNMHSNGELTLDLLELDPSAARCSTVETGIRFDPDTDRVFLLHSGDVVVLENGYGSIVDAVDEGDPEDLVPAISYWKRRVE